MFVNDELIIIIKMYLNVYGMLKKKTIIKLIHGTHPCSSVHISMQPGIELVHMYIYIIIYIDFRERRSVQRRGITRPPNLSMQ